MPRRVSLLAAVVVSAGIYLTGHQWVSAQQSGGGASAVTRVAAIPSEKGGQDIFGAYEVVAGWPKDVAAYRNEKGFRGAYLCCDRKTGETKSISFWRTKEDTAANERSGAFQATVDPYRDMIAIAPTRSYWNVRVVV